MTSSECRRRVGLSDLLHDRRAKVVDLHRDLGVRRRAAARAPGSLVNHLLGIQRHRPGPLRPADGTLLLPAARAELPDIDIDVESAAATKCPR